MDSAGMLPDGYRESSRARPPSFLEIHELAPQAFEQRLIPRAFAGGAA